MSRSSGDHIAATTSQFQRAKLEYKRHLDDIGYGNHNPVSSFRCANSHAAYNELEERVHKIEDSVPAQIGELQRQIKSYEEHKKATQDALKKLQGHSQSTAAERCSETLSSEQIKSKLNELELKDSERNQSYGDLEKKVGTLTDSLNREVDNLSKKIKYLDGQSRKTEVLQSDHAETTALVQLLLKRVQVLESRATDKQSPSSLRSMSTQELVDTLLDRMNGGETLDEATSARLRRLTSVSGSINSTEANARSARVLYTPSTDSERVLPTSDRAQDSLKGFLSQSVERREHRLPTKPNDSPAQRTRNRTQADDPDEEDAESTLPNKLGGNRKRHSAAQKPFDDASDSPKNTTRKRKRGAEGPDQSQQAESHHHPAPAVTTLSDPPRKRGRPRKYPQVSPEKVAAPAAAQNEHDNENEDEDADENEEDEEPPQLRRTSRAFKPTPRGEQFMSRLEVRNQNRNKA